MLPWLSLISTGCAVQSWRNPWIVTHAINIDKPVTRLTCRVGGHQLRVKIPLTVLKSVMTVHKQLTYKIHYLFL